MSRRGASIVQSVLLPKLVYMLAYAKATAAQLLEIEQSYGLMLRYSLSCDASFPRATQKTHRLSQDPSHLATPFIGAHISRGFSHLFLVLMAQTVGDMDRLARSRGSSRGMGNRLWGAISLEQI